MRMSLGSLQAMEIDRGYLLELQRTVRAPRLRRRIATLLETNHDS